jgi:hypothetical protein
VEVMNLEPSNHSRNPLTSSRFLDRRGYLLRDLEDRGIVWLWYVDEIVYFYLRNDESMSEREGIHIEKGIGIFILIDLIG